MICDTCVKRLNATKCAALVGKLPVWGPECTAYTDDKQWNAKHTAAVEAYTGEKAQKRAKGVRGDG